MRTNSNKKRFFYIFFPPFFISCLNYRNIFIMNKGNRRGKDFYKWVASVVLQDKKFWLFSLKQDFTRIMGEFGALNSIPFTLLKWIDFYVCKNFRAKEYNERGFIASCYRCNKTFFKSFGNHLRNIRGFLTMFCFWNFQKERLNLWEKWGWKEPFVISLVLNGEVLN